MIRLEGITKNFGSLQVLKGIDLEINKGEVVSIVGPSGAGKTTLLQIMGTLDEPDNGNVYIDGTKVSKMKEKELSAFRNKHVGFVFQFHQLLPEFTALENVMIPALIAGTSSKEATARALEILSFMGLAERASHKPNELSGGEKQRVAVARALQRRTVAVGRSHHHARRVKGLALRVGGLRWCFRDGDAGQLDAAASAAHHVKYQTHAVASVLRMFTVRLAVGASLQWKVIFPAVVTSSA